MKEKRVLPKTADGQKLYPVCNWERNQHKLYNVLNLTIIMADETKDDAIWEKTDRIEYLIEQFNACVIDGTAYMLWSEGQEVRDLINDYNAFKKEEMAIELEYCDIPTELGWEEYGEAEFFKLEEI